MAFPFWRFLRLEWPLLVLFALFGVARGAEVVGVGVRVVLLVWVVVSCDDNDDDDESNSSAARFFRRRRLLLLVGVVRSRDEKGRGSGGDGGRGIGGPKRSRGSKSCRPEVVAFVRRWCWSRRCLEDGLCVLAP